MEHSRLAGMVLGSQAGAELRNGRLRLLVLKRGHDRHGPLYTLSLVDGGGRVLRRGPVHVPGPRGRRMVADMYGAILLMAFAAAGAAAAAALAGGLGDALISHYGCDMPSARIWQTSGTAGLGYVAVAVNNEGDRAARIAIASPDGSAEFCHGSGCGFGNPAGIADAQPPGVAEYEMSIRSDHGRGDAVLLEVRLDYGGGQSAACSRMAEVR